MAVSRRQRDAAVPGPLFGFTIGVVAGPMHGELGTSLEAAGANVRYGPPADQRALRRLIAAVAGSSLDAVVFPDAPAADKFLRNADMAGLLADVSAALSSTVLCVCASAVTAAPLRDAGIPTVCPEQARRELLAGEIIERVPRRAIGIPVAGHVLQLRGSAAMVDDVLVPLPAGSMALLRELARRPGQVLSRETLAALLPGEHSEAHAVEVAIGRLRLALGDPAIVQTVVKRGYRLSIDNDPAPSRLAALG